MLTGELSSIVSVDASQGCKLLPPPQVGSKPLTHGPVRLYIGVKLQGLHSPPPPAT
jgi:hypothetical protein